MNFEPDVSYCYLSGTQIQSALKQPKVLDALMQELQVPGKPWLLRALSIKDKRRAIEIQVEHFCGSRTSIWSETEPEDVVAAALWRSHHDHPFVATELFSSVRREESLVEPVLNWLDDDGFDAYTEVPMGRCRADVVGHRKAQLLGLRPQRVVAVELKNDLAQLRRGLDQMVTYRDYAHEVYLACTPALAAQYLDSHSNGRAVQRWDADVLDRKLETFGIGLLLVEGDDVTVHRESARTPVRKSKLSELEHELCDNEV